MKFRLMAPVVLFIVPMPLNALAQRFGSKPCLPSMLYEIRLISDRYNYRFARSQK